MALGLRGWHHRDQPESNPYVLHHRNRYRNVHSQLDSDKFCGQQHYLQVRVYHALLEPAHGIVQSHPENQHDRAPDGTVPRYLDPLANFVALGLRGRGHYECNQTEPGPHICNSRHLHGQSDGNERCRAEYRIKTRLHHIRDTGSHPCPE